MQAPLSSPFSRALLNVWIGMCRGWPGLPRQLRDWGYSDRWIDHRFSNQDGEPVHPDLIIASELKANALLLEFKSGANTEADQLRRDARIVSTDLVHGAQLRATETGSHDVVIIGYEDLAARLRLGIEAEAYPFPLLGVAQDGLALLGNSFSDTQVDALFRPLLAIDWATAPTSFVRIDGESSPWEVAEATIPDVLARLIRREPRFNVDDVCRSVSETWPILGEPAKQGVRARVKDVLSMAAAGSFSPYIALRGTTVDVKSNPIELPLDRRTREYRRLRSAQEAFMADLRERGYGVQLGLFDRST